MSDQDWFDDNFGDLEESTDESNFDIDTLNNSNDSSNDNSNSNEEKES